MDQSKTFLPLIKLQYKFYSTCYRLKIHIMGCMLFGRSVVSTFYIPYGNYKFHFNRFGGNSFFAIFYFVTCCKPDKRYTRLFLLDKLDLNFDFFPNKSICTFFGSLPKKIGFLNLLKWTLIPYGSIP